MTSRITSHFDLLDSSTRAAIFSVKATVTSVICKGNLDNPWTIEILINSC